VKGLSLRRFDVGIRIESSTNRVFGNHVGSELPGVTNGNGVGIIVGSVCCNTIGGTNAADRNVIAGNSGNSIRISESMTNPARDNRILGNFVGVRANGNSASANPASSGISIRASINTVVGGLEPGARNIISSGNGGVTVYGPATNTFVLGNYIGVGADGITLLMPGVGGGVYTLNEAGGDTDYPQTIRVEGNRIANYGWGVSVSEDFFDPSTYAARRITITRNAIFGNLRDGISLTQLSRTNDLWDLDEGANGRQNYPELSSVGLEDATLITGALNSAPSSAYRIEFFANTVPHPSGFGEGETYLGFTNVTTDFNGTAPFEITLPGVLAFQPFITATATDSDGNTSMFSRPVHGRSPAAVLFHLHPKPITSLPYTNVTFVADASGAEPLTFQWRRNGVDIPNATNATLTLSNIVWDNRGTYSLIASNSFGAVESLPAELTVLAQPTILVQPTNVIVFPGSNVTFTVQAGGMLPITYQWRRNGVDVPGATSTSLFLPSVDWPLRGDYTVVLSNAFGVTESAPAGLFVKIKPGIAQQPISQNVVTGGTVTLSVAISNSATLPLTYLWRVGSAVVASNTSMGFLSYLTLSNVQRSAAYAVQITNLFGPSGVLSSYAILSMLADADGDGLPDTFEDAYSLDRNNPADAALDTDHDGATNAQEYSAGTDPQDPLNRLRVDRIGENGGASLLEFATRSNKTYTVQFRDALSGTGWLSLTNLPARASNGVERVTDPQPGSHRFYRLVTPSQL
jgi:hypothetical protein